MSPQRKGVLGSGARAYLVGQRCSDGAELDALLCEQVLRIALGAFQEREFDHQFRPDIAAVRNGHVQPLSGGCLPGLDRLDERTEPLPGSA
jgi:hypothetical protein